MAVRGRKPLPTQLKVIKGTLQNCRANPAEFVPPDGKLEMPEFVAGNPRAEKYWAHVMRDSPQGMFKPLDVHLLGLWCTAIATAEEAALQVRQRGLLVKSPVKGEPMQNPYLAILNRQVEIARKIGSEIGLTPASRSRIADVGKVASKDDPWETF